MRVVSLLPSATEILCHIGGSDLLVGRSHECDFPAGLDHLPALTAQTTAYDPSSPAAAADIDAAVRAQTAQGKSLYTLDTDLLADLKPDVILTQDLCSVCSIDLAAVRVAADQIGTLTGSAPRVVSLNPATVEAVLDDVIAIGEAVGLGEKARHRVVDLRGRLFRAQEFVDPYADGSVVGFLEWTDPLFIAGHWTVQLIERAGGRHPLNETVARPGVGLATGPQQGERVAGPSIAVDAEVFAATRPQWLVIAPCGLNLSQAKAEADKLREHEWFNSLPAVQAGRVAIVDGSAMFNRPGPRLVDAFEWLVGWMHDRPVLIPDGFPWQQWA